MGNPNKNRPLVFTKTGLDGAEPMGFYQAVAQAYRADLHSTDAIRVEKFKQADRTTNMFSGGISRFVRYEIERRTAASLAAGRNVVYDGFLNTFDRREDIRDLADKYGALAVSLTVRAPIPLIKERLTARLEADALTIPRDMSPLEDRLEVMQHMARQLQRDGGWVHRNPDEVGETVVLDGRQPVAYLLGQVADHLEALEAREEVPLDLDW